MTEENEDPMILGALLVGAITLVGSFMKIHEAGVENGKRKQFALDQERAKKKGIEL